MIFCKFLCYDPVSCLWNYVEYAAFQSDFIFYKHLILLIISFAVWLVDYTMCNNYKGDNKSLWEFMCETNVF